MLVATYSTKKLLSASIGESLRYEETSFIRPEYVSTGTLFVVGPSALNRRWFAQVTMENGTIKKVK